MRTSILAFLLVALLPIAGHSETPAVKPDNPGGYTVVRGDTLWDISGRFLEEPWQWPSIWEVNPQIENPHLIYPGDVISLTYRDGRPVLSVNRGSRYVKLSPEIRSSELSDAIPSIPIDAIQPFLSQPLIVSADEMSSWPYVFSSEDQRLISGSGNRVYVRGLAEDADETRYSIYRKGPAYRVKGADGRYADGEILGYPALYIGDATIEKFGDPASAKIVNSEREILAGDRLLPYAEGERIRDFIPKMPGSEISGQVVSVIDGVSEIGQYQVVVLSVGNNDGVETGNMLGVYQSGIMVRDNVTDDVRTDDRKSKYETDFFRLSQNKGEPVELPEEYAGAVMVFRVFDKVSYALVMQTAKPLHIYDSVRNL
ncbi:MAG: LysM peptidoglycan-binding domain-containing protein [Gammaproteobacteria bacterium]